MKYAELNHIWKRIFEAEWESVCHKSKAIAAVIVDENGEIIPEGRNKMGEVIIPNPRVNHAEVEAVRNLDIGKYPYVKSYTLYAALEPCPMCLGTLVMGGITLTEKRPLECFIMRTFSPLRKNCTVRLKRLSFPTIW